MKLLYIYDYPHTKIFIAPKNKWREGENQNENEKCEKQTKKNNFILGSVIWEEAMFGFVSVFMQ